jgi:L-lactate dehydrogenase complex protein LldG
VGAKESIFRKLASAVVKGDTSYPDYSHPHTGITDPEESFREVLEAVGGACYFVKGHEEINSLLPTLPAYASARQICSCVHGIRGNVDIDSAEKARELKDVDLAVVRGDFGVGENGAVWVNADGLRHRAILFLAENLILVIESGRIVRDMESAYGMVDFNNLRSGYFISGPSKTADIEQSLVIGAHGARSLIVFVVRKGLL